MPDLFIIICAGLFGLCFGSFANVVIYRLPKNLSIITPPSACPFCEKRLNLLELIPVLSQLFLLGKCRECKTKISLRYPLVELLCGLLFAAMAHYSPTLSVLPLSVFAFVLLVISFIDADTQEIPDGLVIIGVIAGIIYVAGGHFFPELFPCPPLWHNALIGVIAGAAPLLIIDRITLLVLKKDGFGYGDVKLMAMVGLFIGWRMMLPAYLFALFSATFFIIYLMITGKTKRGAYIAFGPFLCAGTLFALWFGEYVFALYDWYIASLAI
ncbi:MAG: prepilin peptidase [Defluviitaleaceae bacterium]|nr:prepilin peptidase [Defluviitaleaceae bacterium]